MRNVGENHVATTTDVFATHPALMMPCTESGFALDPHRHVAPVRERRRNAVSTAAIKVQ